MSWSWLGGIISAALLSITATMPARADCYCSKNPGSDAQVCGEVVQKDEKEVRLRGLEGHRKDLVAVFDLNQVTYCPEITPPVLPPEGRVTSPAVTPPPEGRVTSPPVTPPPPPPVERVTTPLVTPAPPPPSLPTFGIVGSNTIGEELMPPLIVGFGQHEKLEIKGKGCLGRLILSGPAFPETAINCEAFGTHFGIPALKSGRAEIAMLSRPITGDERTDIATVTNPVEHVLALDGVVVIVSPSNPVTGLTLDQIGQIFAGEIRNWSRLHLPGVPAGPINLYMRDVDSGTRDTFDNLVMKPRSLTLAASGQQFRSSSELAAKVATDPNGIGFVGYAYRGGAKALDIALSCGLTHHPTDVGIKSEDYPLARRLFLYTGKAPSAVATRLLEYALSDEAQPIINKANFIDLSISKEGARDGRDRIGRYGDPNLRPSEPELDFEPAVFGKLQRSTNGAERLSISFRFQFRSRILDSRALADVRRLAKYLNTDASGRRVLLAGFTDAKGPFAYNLGLSQERADEVRKALIAEDVDRKRLTADGFSELLPVICNSADDEHRSNDPRFDEEVRQKNRRVEVWLLP